MSNAELESRVPEFLTSFDAACVRALHMVGGVSETSVKETLTANGSVDTGLLRNSVTYALAGEAAQISGYSSNDGSISGSYAGTAPADTDPNKKSVYVGTNVEYAPYVELGHSQQPGRYVPKLGKRLKASWVNAKPYLRPGVEAASSQFEAIFELCFAPFNEK